MFLKRILGLLAVLFCLFGVPQIASAGCWDYYGGTLQHCTGTNGCKDIYFVYYCGPGCVSGECFNNGGGGLCCGHQYQSAVIYGDGGECDPDMCGPHAFGGLKKTSASSVEKPQSQSPPAERYSRLLLVPDRCAHGYGVIVQSPRIGGM